MIGKMIGAFVGSKAAQSSKSLGGPTGAVLGVLAPAILRRVSLPAMIAIGAGGYLVKKVMDKDAKRQGEPAVTPLKNKDGLAAA
ncbi:hypothetical protein [Paraurantiacibacter namhicola]|uniref:Uncharacterized protein n=1 Tax=Paraurantiacibacter namhicola TaxID=645517 RepID=A0A1C7DB52_9SPHN|nr:hypothetical protein [Paraurantiacibacter namhicola]ANU08716.1 hypothetical protein A6F65_02435 [Paraurantiacibacter namhicola]